MERLTGMSRGVTAAGQLQKSHASHDSHVQPLPKGTPGRAKGKGVGIDDPGDAISFYVIGDHGGVKSPGPQNAVSYAMQKADDGVSFVYSVGDIVYFYGEEGEYAHQFYEPYAHLAVPIVGHPGNHDGDLEEEGGGPRSLEAFMTNFCDDKPSVPPSDPELEFGRHTQTQPYCDWTLELEAVTIVGIYSNVPPGGHLEPQQIDWLTGELGDAAADKPLIVSLHHPPYSVDSHHGGSEEMGKILDKAFDDSGRTPDLVMSGHVHDYQRFTRKRGEKTIRYLVVGNSGYHNLHLFAKDTKVGEEPENGKGVTFDFGDAKEYGFLKLTVKGGKITGEYSGVKPGTMPDGSDMTVTAAKDSF
jgi:hypothetical protein